MTDAFEPVTKQGLADRLAQRLRGMIQRGDYVRGDRLPAIVEIARSFGVGHPTVREALKKLETLGVVEIRHGSGVYVRRSEDVLVLATPGYAGTVSKKLLLDLIQSRKALEMLAVAAAIEQATAEDLQEMRSILEASTPPASDEAISLANRSFHRQIALASGNTVLVQLLDVLRELFAEERRLILDTFGSHERSRQDHQGILEALERRDATLAVERVRQHLEGVRAAILSWDPERHPVG